MIIPNHAKDKEIERRRRQIKRYQQKLQDQPPVPLPYPRPRRLSFPLDNDDRSSGKDVHVDRRSLGLSSLRSLVANVKGKRVARGSSYTRFVEQRTCLQEQSPLFRLPVEIRHAIWCDVVGVQKLHVAHEPGRLYSIECRFQDFGPGNLSDRPPRDDGDDLKDPLHCCWSHGGFGGMVGFDKECMDLSYFSGQRIRCQHDESSAPQEYNGARLLRLCRLM